jgi:glutathione S-transferase
MTGFSGYPVRRGFSILSLNALEYWGARSSRVMTPGSVADASSRYLIDLSAQQELEETPMLTLHHLNDSRSQRVLWLLEELGVPYEMKKYQRMETRLAPPELAVVHPLGKSPVITDGDVRIAESGAIVDYVIRRHGKGAMMPAPGGAEYETYNEWLHYAEGSGMLPLMLNLYVSRLKEAGAPLHPRIDSEIANHLGYVDGALKGREFFVGKSLSGADIQMSFVGDMAKIFDKLGPYPNLGAWLKRMHARPAFQRSIEKGGAYRFAK